MRMATAVRLWEEKEGKGECKNQIHCHCHHRGKGGREDLTIAMPWGEDAHVNSAARVYGPAGRTIGRWRERRAGQDAVEDDGG
jgi:hypothetical protein